MRVVKSKIIRWAVLVERKAKTNYFLVFPLRGYIAA
jgi:hypothetical protein